MAAAVTVFSSDAYRILSNLVTVLGISVCSFCIARRSVGIDLVTRRGRSSISLAKWCVLLVFLDSWVFMTLSGLLINGVGLSASPQACELAIIACIAFYALSKCLIYAYLMEKVYIVWSAGTTIRRLQTPIWRVCAVILLAYTAVIIMMVMFRVSHLSLEDGKCIIGLKRSASITLLSYDLFMNVWLTGLFLWPLTRATLHNSRLRRMAIRTLIAAAVALTSSTVNIAILTSCNGQELGWVCLASCGADVTINAIALYWLTGTSLVSGGSGTVPQLKTISVHAEDEEKNPALRQPARFGRPYPNTPSLPNTDYEVESVQTSSTVTMKFAPPPPIYVRVVGLSPSDFGPSPPASPLSKATASPTSSCYKVPTSPSSCAKTFSLKRSRSGSLIQASVTSIPHLPPSTPPRTSIALPEQAVVHPGRPEPTRAFSWSPGTDARGGRRQGNGDRGEDDEGLDLYAPAPLKSSKWARILWFGPPPRRKPRGSTTLRGDDEVPPPPPRPSFQSAVAHVETLSPHLSDSPHSRPSDERTPSIALSHTSQRHDSYHCPPD